MDNLAKQTWIWSLQISEGPLEGQGLNLSWGFYSLTWEMCPLQRALVGLKKGHCVGEVLVFTEHLCMYYLI